jgi:hypothetical protein
VREFSSRQKRLKGGRFLPQAAPPPKEGRAMKESAFLGIAVTHLLPLGVPLSLQDKDGGQAVGCCKTPAAPARRNWGLSAHHLFKFVNGE